MTAPPATGHGCSVHERAPAYAAAAAAVATLIASVATHPIKRYRSRLQAGVAADGAGRRDTAATGGRIAACLHCAWFEGLGITLVHTVSTNALMYVFKEQLAVHAMRVMQT